MSGSISPSRQIVQATPKLRFSGTQCTPILAHVSTCLCTVPAHSSVNSRTGQPYRTIAKQWGRIRKRAEVPFLRIHDLRHAFASFLVSNGVSLWVVATLPGHSDPKVTTRYAHLTTKALESAVNVALLKITGGDVFAGMAKADQ